MNKQDHTDEDLSPKVIDKINELLEKSTRGDYIYRGETECHDKVSSTLYRQYEDKIKNDNFDIEIAQAEMLKQAKEYTTQENDSEILAELQHYGGKTNLIDFTTDCLIALFFACDGGAPNKNGRVIFLQKTDEENIWPPRNPNSRVIAQKSVFVQPKKGFVVPAEVIDVPHNLKKPILNYLQKSHGISTQTIYNDLHGFIKSQDIHHSAYTNFYMAMTAQDKDDYEKDKGLHDKATEYYDKAIQYYTEAIKCNPNFAEAYINRGLTYKGRGNLNQAIQDYSKAIELNPNLAEAYNNRGNAHGNKGGYDQAIRDFNKTIELKPNYAAAYNNRGIAHGNRGDYDQAIRDYNQAIGLKPNFTEAYTNRGNAYFGQGDFDQAIRDYDQAIKLKPDYAVAYNNRGFAHGKKGNYDQAIRDYNKAIDLKPNYSRAYCNRGTVWLLKKAWDKARSDLKTPKEKGANIARLFFDASGRVSAFEKQHHIQLPQDIRDMLTE